MNLHWNKNSLNRLTLETLEDGETTSVYNAANQLVTAESLSGITTYIYD